MTPPQTSEHVTQQFEPDPHAEHPQSQGRRIGPWATAGVAGLAALSALMVPGWRESQSSALVDNPVPAQKPLDRDATPVAASTNHPEIPAQYLPPFKDVTSPELRAELKRGFERMFWLDHPANGAEYIAIISDSLVQGGLSRAEAAKTAVAVINDGFLNFTQRREASAMLAEIFPQDLGSWYEKVKLHDNLAAVGKVRPSFLGSDLLDDPTSPPQIEISCNQFSVDTKGVELDDSMTVKATAVFYADGHDPVEAPITHDLSFVPDKRGYYYHQQQTFPLSIPESLRSENANAQLPSIRVKISYQVQPFRGSEATGGAAYSAETWALFEPLKNAKGGYTVTPLAADGSTLDHPEIPNTVARWMHIRAVMQQKSIQAALTGEVKSVEAQSALIGRDLPSLKLAAHSAGAPDSLTIPAKGDVVIEFGATWCGPCKGIAPRFEQFSSVVSEKGVKVFRLSIDADKGRFAEALKAYPDGIVTQEAANALALNSIPFYVQVRDGKIIDAKNTTPYLLDEMQRQYLSK